MKKLNCLVIIMLITLFLSAQEIPQKISYQGKLLENGIAVNDTKTINFIIGSWDEIHYNVPIIEGLYSVTLGETNPIPVSLFDNTSNLSLQIQVEGIYLDPETNIKAVPYAFKTEEAVNSESIHGNPVGGNPSPNQVLTWSGTQWQPEDVSTNPTGTAGGDLDGYYPNPTVSGLQDNPISSTNPTNEQVLKYDGSEWTPGNDGLTLPYYGTYDGNGSPLMELEATNNSNYFPTLKLFNDGTGDALEIENETGGHSIDITHYGNNTVIQIDNQGGGAAIDATGHVEISSDTDQSSLNVENDGTSYCGYFRTVNSSNTTDAIYAMTTGSGYAGYFNGSLYATTASSGIKAFKIDHPLDPENKYLFHSSVVSPDMMNVYNGNVVLNNEGEAVVDLPDWFNALNKDYRYQLTCIGVFAPVFVAEEIVNNSFKISGGSEGIKVSWQVTGIRQDPLAEKSRLEVEVAKSEIEKGHYLHYKEYGQPYEKSIEMLKNPEILEELNK